MHIQIFCTRHADNMQWRVADWHLRRLKEPRTDHNQGADAWYLETDELMISARTSNELDFALRRLQESKTHLFAAADDMGNAEGASCQYLLGMLKSALEDSPETKRGWFSVMMGDREHILRRGQANWEIAA